MTTKKNLLLIAHTPSPNLKALADAVLRGAQHPDIEAVQARLIAPLQATAEDVLTADAIILLTPENLAYMSGAMKDFFDRIYYPCLEEKQGLPCAIIIRAGHDGTGTKRALETILTGLKWRIVQEVLTCRGDFKEEFTAQCEELGTCIAASLDAGII
ncbi:MAG TPA: flavodoxin family protein [Cycloclasticus sp.]|jgi:NAD(P)H-dependent FMN reductase|nr:flavodoxin family protein [Cycloclasticus sp.]HIL92982.1 flavodoxin family protein [Cycloclasticus sp.]